jgi:hypothetical protein
MIKLYGLYSDIKELWNILFTRDYLKEEYIILGEDLTFVTKIAKIWIDDVPMDPLVDHFLCNI